MCIQSYYKDIELNLLREIKDFGIDAWNKQVNEQAEDEVKHNYNKNYHEKNN